MTGHQYDQRTSIVNRPAITAEYEAAAVDVTTPAPAGKLGALPHTNPQPGERYELLGEIARGGMGVLLRGRDRLLGREVVIKLLRSDLSGCPAAERRFLREARVNGQLQHPGIVPVYDVGRFADGRPFLTMKFVAGQTLDSLLAVRTTADRPHLLRLFEQVCHTVAYAHAKGVVHRDLKPLNVMSSRFGQVRVLDWGLAKVLTTPDEEHDGDLDPEATGRFTSPDDTGELTLSGDIAGTPSFMPPEQAAGDPTLDERADVFALGGLLCAILTGRPPYTGPDLPAVWAKAKVGELTEAHAALQRSQDRAFARLATACLSADPATRPRDGGEVMKAVAAARNSSRPSWLSSLKTRLRR